MSVGGVRPSNNNRPNKNPDFPLCHHYIGDPFRHVTVNRHPGPRFGRYVSVFHNNAGRPLLLCEVEVYEAQCKCHEAVCT